MVRSAAGKERRRAGRSSRRRLGKALFRGGGSCGGTPTLLSGSMGSLLVLAACGDGAGEDAPPTDARAPEEAAPEAGERELLESLGYVNLVPAAGDGELESGVTVHDPRAYQGGLNLFNSRDESVAKLMTMEGEVVHTWSSDAEGAVFRRFEETLPSHVPGYVRGWNHVEWVEGGDLLVIGTHHMLLRLDWSSNVEWKRDVSAHHDVSVAADGTIHVLTDGIRVVEVGGERIAFQDNRVTVMTPEGQTVRELSVYDTLEEPLRDALRQRLLAIVPAREARLASLRHRAETGGAEERELLRLYERATRGDLGDDEGVMNLLFHNYAEDVFHANALQVLERDRPGLWSAGDLLLTVRAIDSVIAIDHETGELLWSWGRGELQAPHHATHVADGHVLVFDNGVQRKRSRVVKVDPTTGEIVWQYTADPPSAFFSAVRGGCQELPNGNVLIAETDTGRAFEVTPDGEVVWEYFDEVVRVEDGEEKRGAIYRMTRIDADTVERAKARQDA